MAWGGLLVFQTLFYRLTNYLSFIQVGSNLHLGLGIADSAP